tara:strand:+ start:3542 stop:3790 length:249 start_codon:yes stop_codon:yes gene_type:complete
MLGKQKYSARDSALNEVSNFHDYILIFLFLIVKKLFRVFQVSSAHGSGLIKSRMYPLHLKIIAAMVLSSHQSNLSYKKVVAI